MQFYVMIRTHVTQFTFVYIAKCHSTKSWIMSSYFPMTGFRATVCVSTEVNRHNCAPTCHMGSHIDRTQSTLLCSQLSHGVSHRQTIIDRTVPRPVTWKIIWLLHNFKDTSRLGNTEFLDCAFSFLNKYKLIYTYTWNKVWGQNIMVYLLSADTVKWQGWSSPLHYFTIVLSIQLRCHAILQSETEKYWIKSTWWSPCQIFQS